MIISIGAGKLPDKIQIIHQKKKRKNSEQARIRNLLHSAKEVYTNSIANVTRSKLDAMK